MLRGDSNRVTKVENLILGEPQIVCELAASILFAVWEIVGMGWKISAWKIESNLRSILTYEGM